MNVKRLILIAASGSAALMLGAMAFQFIGNMAPCKMCIWQRYPHVAAILIGALAMITRRYGLAWLGALAALITGGIGVYHAGVERKIWAGPDSCTSGSVAGQSVDDLMDQIMSAPLVRCDDIPWEMFGVSMAGWNAIISLSLAVIWVLAARATGRQQ